MSEQLMPPDIAGINSVLTISFSCFSWLLRFGIVRVKYVGSWSSIFTEGYIEGHGWFMLKSSNKT